MMASSFTWPAESMQIADWLINYGQLHVFWRNDMHRTVRHTTSEKKKLPTHSDLLDNKKMKKVYQSLRGFFLTG